MVGLKLGPEPEVISVAQQDPGPGEKPQISAGLFSTRGGGSGT